MPGSTALVTRTKLCLFELSLKWAHWIWFYLNSSNHRSLHGPSCVIIQSKNSFQLREIYCLLCSTVHSPWHVSYMPLNPQAHRCIIYMLIASKYIKSDVAQMGLNPADICACVDLCTQTVRQKWRESIVLNYRELIAASWLLPLRAEVGNYLRLIYCFLIIRFKNVSRFWNKASLWNGKFKQLT